MKLVGENVEYEQWLSWANCATVIRPFLVDRTRRWKYGREASFSAQKEILDRGGLLFRHPDRRAPDVHRVSLVTP